MALWASSPVFWMNLVPVVTMVLIAGWTLRTIACAALPVDASVLVVTFTAFWVADLTPFPMARATGATTGATVFTIGATTWSMNGSTTWSMIGCTTWSMNGSTT